VRPGVKPPGAYCLYVSPSVDVIRSPMRSSPILVIRLHSSPVIRRASVSLQACLQISRSLATREPSPKWCKPLRQACFATCGVSYSGAIARMKPPWLNRSPSVLRQTPIHLYSGLHCCQYSRFSPRSSASICSAVIPEYHRAIACDPNTYHHPGSPDGREHYKEEESAL
jgi:hypothetical protein